MKPRYRTWPAIVVAVAGATAAAVVVGAQALPAERPTGPGQCHGARSWVAVSPVQSSADGRSVLLAGYPKQLMPVLTGCLDLRRVPPVDPADPRS